MIAMLQSISSTSHSTSFKGSQAADLHLIRGPVKQPFRCLEKVVRVYRRDVSCVTDIVRCTIVANKVQHLLRLMQKLQHISIVGVETEPTPEDREKLFRIVQLKNRFDSESEHYDKRIGYRDIGLNLEVGAVVEGGKLAFLPVQLWKQRRAITHIIEVQVHLGSMYEVSSRGGHQTYERWRDLLAQ